MDNTHENTHNENEYTSHSDESLHNLALWLQQVMQKNTRKSKER